MVAETSSSSREVRRGPFSITVTLGTEAAVHLRELQGDVATADDHQMLWHRVEFEDAHIRHVVDVGESGHIRCQQAVPLPCSRRVHP